MSRYRITTEDEEEYIPYVPRKLPTKKSNEEYFGKQTISGIGHYEIPKMRTEKELVY